MTENNLTTTIGGICIIVLIGCYAYFGVVESNNSKEIVVKAIERGLDPITAACAGQISTSSKDVRNTCEKMAIIKGGK